MKCVVLVGGYATRLEYLVKHQAKALLKIDNQTILDIIFNNIKTSTIDIDEYILVTNDTFYDDFVEWKNNQDIDSIKIISDGSTCNEDKVGAGSALLKTIIELNIQDDIFVLAGDNILDFSLKYIFDDFKASKYSNVMYYEELDNSKLKRTGIIEIDHDNNILSMEEKPNFPKTKYAVPPFYWLKKNDVKLLIHIFKNYSQIDSMGTIMCELCKHTNILAKKMNGKRYSIGTIEEYHNTLNLIYKST